MNKNKFKLIELENYQVLLTKNYDSEEDIDSPYQLTVTVFQDGVRIDVSLGFSDEDLRDSTFDKIGEEDVILILRNSVGIWDARL